MLFGAAGQSMSMVILAIVNYLAEKDPSNQGPGIGATLFLFVFNTFFAIGWLGMVKSLVSITMKGSLLDSDVALPGRDSSATNSRTSKRTLNKCQLVSLL